MREGKFNKITREKCTKHEEVYATRAARADRDARGALKKAGLGTACRPKVWAPSWAVIS